MFIILRSNTLIPVVCETRVMLLVFIIIKEMIRKEKFVFEYNYYFNFVTLYFICIYISLYLIALCSLCYRWVTDLYFLIESSVSRELELKKCEFVIKNERIIYQNSGRDGIKQYISTIKKENIEKSSMISDERKRGKNRMTKAMASAQTTCMRARASATVKFLACPSRCFIPAASLYDNFIGGPRCSAVVFNVLFRRASFQPTPTPPGKGARKLTGRAGLTRTREI